MLIFTLLVATLIVVICFICLLYFVANVLNKRYVIVLIDNSYQLIDANTLENYVDNVNNVLDIDERNYLNITLISFSLFMKSLSARVVCISYLVCRFISISASNPKTASTRNANSTLTGCFRFNTPFKTD